MPTPKLSTACRQSQPVLTKEKHPPIPKKHLLENPVFAMASQQFDLAADVLDLPQELRERTKWPKRMITVSLPVRMDNGEVHTFTGHRVQHHLTLGPGKGGIRYAPDVELGEVAALAM